MCVPMEDIAESGLNRPDLAAMSGSTVSRVTGENHRGGRVQTGAGVGCGNRRNSEPALTSDPGCTFVRDTTYPLS